MIPLLNIEELWQGIQAKEKNIYNAIISYINNLVSNQKPIPLTDGATITWNVQKGYNAYVTLGGNRTLVLGGLNYGDYGSIDITQDGSGNRSITLPSNSIVANGGGGAVTLSSGAGAKDTLNFKYDSDGKIRWTLITNFT